jgi:hypothetical protein
MAAILKASRAMFTKHPLIANMTVYGTLYVGAELSQQMLTRKLEVKLFRQVCMQQVVHFRIHYLCSFVQFVCKIYCFSYLQNKQPAADIDKLGLGRYAVMGTFIISPMLYNWYVHGLNHENYIFFTNFLFVQQVQMVGRQISRDNQTHYIQKIDVRSISHDTPTARYILYW